MAKQRNAPGAHGSGLLERPLTARSVLASLLLGMHPPRLAGARLVRWCGVFGIAEGTARVALSRMVDRGELAATDGVYELAGPVRARQRVQEWSLDPDAGDWDGSWGMGAVVGAARDAADRAGLRDAMRRLRYAEAPRRPLGAARRTSHAHPGRTTRGRWPTRSASGGPRDPSEIRASSRPSSSIPTRGLRARRRCSLR